MKDSEPTTLRPLLHEMEESEIVDCTVNMHELSRRAVGEGQTFEKNLSICFFKTFFQDKKMEMRSSSNPRRRSSTCNGPQSRPTSKLQTLHQLSPMMFLCSKRLNSIKHACLGCPNITFPTYIAQIGPSQLDSLLKSMFVRKMYCPMSKLPYIFSTYMVQTSSYISALRS